MPGLKFPPPGLTLALLAILLPELLLSCADLLILGSPGWRPLAYQYGGFWAGLLHGWRPNFTLQPATMFATYAFLHTGPTHALGNALALLGLGRILEDRGGSRLLWPILGVSALSGAAAFGLLSRSPAPMVGTSGAIFGLAGALVVWWAREPPAAGRRLGRFFAGIAGLALMNAASWWAMGGQLAWEAHLGGMSGGMALAAIRRCGARPS